MFSSNFRRVTRFVNENYTTNTYSVVFSTRPYGVLGDKKIPGRATSAGTKAYCDRLNVPITSLLETKD
eukprot:Pgem_evm1s6653